MYLRKADILNFKNIREATLEFSSGVNCLLGRNGMGKSNLLEAVYFLCMARSMSGVTESGLILHGEESFIVKGEFLADTDTREEVSAGVVKGKGKSLKRNGKEYARVSEHIGRFPLVSVTPADHTLVSGSAEVRRRLLDTVISQSDSTYLSNLIRYGRALESRNRMLRAGVRDNILYDSVETQMHDAAAAVHDSRRQWIKEISPVFEKRYRMISGDSESASLAYRSQIDSMSMRELLDSRRQKDLVLGYTSAGVHRDDIDCRLDDWSMRTVGSQGQVKTFTIALRLAIFDFLRSRAKSMPILLLDDIFDKLDSDRVERIMEVVSDHSDFGQIFITDTNRKHLDDILSSISGEHFLMEVVDGSFYPL